MAYSLLTARRDLLAGITVVAKGGALLLWAGDQFKTLEWSELKEYRGQRAQRGSVLRRGWPRKIDRLEAR